MRVLEAASALKPRYVTVESARRSLDALAALAGVVGTFALFAWSWRYFLDPIITKLQGQQFTFGTAADFSFLLLIPIVFGVITGAVRLAARLGGARLYAKILNCSFMAAWSVRRMAATRPSTFSASRAILPQFPE